MRLIYYNIYMKKTIIAMLSLMVILFYSCSKNDSEGDNIIKGTKWKSTEEVEGKVVAQWILTFSSSSYSINFSSDDNLDGVFDRVENVNGTYTIDGSNVTMSYNEHTQAGTVNGNTLHLYANEVSEEFFFTKE